MKISIRQPLWTVSDVDLMMVQVLEGIFPSLRVHLLVPLVHSPQAEMAPSHSCAVDMRAGKGGRVNCTSNTRETIESGRRDRGREGERTKNANRSFYTCA